ncbi:MAG: GNAT family N-acetyltransferase [Candidatus Competibacterales bacterium]
MVVRHGVWVTEAEGGIVGVLVSIAQADGVLLDNIAIHPAFQGRGLGRRLLATAETLAKTWGSNWFELYTHEATTENFAWYRRCGFIETARRVEQGYPRVYLGKSLS